MRELFVNSFSHPGSVYYRSMVQAIGGYDETLRSAQDADLWERLRRHTRAANLDVPLVRYRKHAEQNTAARSEADRGRSVAIRQRAQAAYLGRDVSPDEARAMVETVHVQPDRRSQPATLRAGLGGLRGILAVARRQERPETVRYYRGLVHDALIGHARQQADTPALRRRLLAEAVLWRPVLSSRRAGAKLLAGIAG
jgi:hypothetical protein